MCFLFGPSNPHAVNPHPCRFCASVPKYWRLIIPAFLAFPDDPEIDSPFYVESSEIVLEWEGINQTVGCYWSWRDDLVQPTGQPRDLPEESFFNVTKSWDLGTYGVYQWGNALDPGVEINNWHVSYHGGAAAWERNFPTPANRDPGDSGLDLGALTEKYTHWDCLGRNRLYYRGLARLDIGGETYAPDLGLPRYVDVEPFTP